VKRPSKKIALKLALLEHRPSNLEAKVEIFPSNYLKPVVLGSNANVLTSRNGMDELKEGKLFADCVFRYHFLFNNAGCACNKPAV
jgi:hypothetical protein